MEYEIVNLKEKTIVGVAGVTSNDDPNMGELIGGLWQKFYNDGYFSAINAISPFPLGVYTDYESDATGKYTIIVAGVSDGSVIPDGAVTKVIPAGRYAKFKVRGNQVTDVGAFWANLWQMDLPRAYTADYEEYCSSDPDDCEVNIYISLKDIESRCGLLCSECGYREQTGCNGCVNINKPFWGESCAVMNCCRDKQHEHCGDCDEFPCEVLHGFAFDPEQGDNGKRLEQCKIWKNEK